MSLATVGFADPHWPMSANTVGYTCDGRHPNGPREGYGTTTKCAARITLFEYNSRGKSPGTGWTFSVDGHAYCLACGPRDNPPHTCPPPPPPPPEPAPLSRADTIDFATLVHITYWHVDERKVRTWDAKAPLVRPAADGLHVLKWDLSEGTFREHVILWAVVIKFEGEGIK